MGPKKEKGILPERPRTTSAAPRTVPKGDVKKDYIEKMEAANRDSSTTGAHNLNSDAAWKAKLQKLEKDSTGNIDKLKFSERNMPVKKRLLREYERTPIKEIEEVRDKSPEKVGIEVVDSMAASMPNLAEIFKTPTKTPRVEGDKKASAQGTPTKELEKSSVDDRKVSVLTVGAKETESDVATSTPKSLLSQKLKSRRNAHTGGTPVKTPSKAAKSGDMSKPVEGKDAPAPSDDHLKQLGEALSALNEDSQRLVTDIHKPDSRSSSPSKRAWKKRMALKTTSKAASSFQSNASPVKKAKKQIIEIQKRKLAKSKAKLKLKKVLQKKCATAAAPGEEEREEESEEDTDSDGDSMDGTNVDEDEEGEEDEEEDEDSDGLEILQPENDTLDQALEMNAKKSNLTTANVKSILHHVLTNEMVVDLMRSTLAKEEGEGGAGPSDAAMFEPILTRSKAKVLETSNVTHPWPISPIKTKSQVHVPSFIEMSFSDDDDEEEYVPDDVETSDSESVVSSQTSDLGSPLSQGPTTPGTPVDRATPRRLGFASFNDSAELVLDKTLTPEPEDMMGKKVLFPEASTSEEKVQAEKEPAAVLMGPPLLPHPKTPKGKDQGDPKHGAEGAENEETIAFRTRSRVKLDDTPLEVIESTFVAPDITEDMYDGPLMDDTDYSEFLTGLMKYDIVGVTEGADDETNDPEYNVMEEEEEVDQEDFRTDRAVRITKKELHELMDELFEICEPENASFEGEEYQDGSKIQDNFNIPPKLNVVPAFHAVLVKDLLKEQKALQEGVPMVVAQAVGADTSGATYSITFDELVQLGHQMRKHVQLLGQTYILADDCPGMEQHAKSAKTYLLELDRFSQAATTQGKISSFRVCNLPEMVSLVKGETDLDKTDKWQIKKIRNKGYQAPDLSPGQMEFMARNRAFIYPELLPICRSIPPTYYNKAKVQFVEAEDNLLALGIVQFSKFHRFGRLIQQHMIPIKTVEQISIRIKNLTAAKTGDNPVKDIKKYKKELHFPLVNSLFYPDTILPPIEQDVYHPTWLREMRENLHAPKPGDTPKQSAVFLVQSLAERSGTSQAVPAKRKLLTEEKKTKRKRRKKGELIDGNVDSPLSSEANSPATSGPDSRPQTPVTGTPSTSVATTPANTGGTPATNPGTVVIHDPAGQVNIQQPLTVLNQGTLQTLVPTGTNPAPLHTQTQSGISSTPVVPGVVQATAPQNASPVVIQNPAAIPQIKQENFSVILNTGQNTGLQTTAGAPQVFQIIPAANSGGSGLLQFTGAPQGGAQGGLVLQDGGIALSNVQMASCGGPALGSQGSIVSSVGSLSAQGRASPLLVVSSMASSTVPTSSMVFTNPGTPQSLTQQNTPVRTPGGTPQHPPGTPTATTPGGATVVGNISSPATPAPLHSPAILTQVGTPVGVMRTPQHPRTPQGTQGCGSMASSPAPAMSPAMKAVSTIGGSKMGALSPASLVHQASPDPKSCPTISKKCKITDGKVTKGSPMKPETRPAKSALEIVAAVAPFLSSTANVVTSPQKVMTSAGPMLLTPTKYKALVPKPGHITPTKSPPFSMNSPVKASPTRKLLQKQVRSILPKGFVYTNTVSPAKKAAKNISARARKRGRPATIRKVMNLSPRKPIRPNLPIEMTSLSNSPPDGSELKDDDDIDEVIAGENDFTSEYDTMDSDPYVSDENEKKDPSGANNKENKSVKSQVKKIRKKKSQQKRKRKYSELNDSDGNDTEDSNSQFPASYSRQDSQEDEADDNAEDENHLAELMAASTTIRFDPKKPLGKAQKGKMNKAKKRREMTLALLASDIVSSDPLRDDRDTAFAHAYLTKVRDVLRDYPDKYEEFLAILFEFSKSTTSPVKLYEDLYSLLGEWPDLVDDFAGFLLPEQAQEAGCYMTNAEFNRARAFLRKLEVNFARHPPHFQKILKALAKWQKSANPSTEDLKNMIKPMLRGQEHLMEEFMLFFPDEHPAESRMTDFEEVTFGSDEEEKECDGFEEVELPDDEEDDVSGTKHCNCKCHEGVESMYQMRKRHCVQCGMRIIGGKIYIQTSGKNMKPAQVVYHNRPPPAPPESSGPLTQADTNARTTADGGATCDKQGVTPSGGFARQNSTGSASSEAVVSGSGQLMVKKSKASKIQMKKRRQLKVKISQQTKNKEGGGQFVALSDMAASDSQSQQSMNPPQFTSPVADTLTQTPAPPTGQPCDAHDASASFASIRPSQPTAGPTDFSEISKQLRQGIGATEPMLEGGAHRKEGVQTEPQSKTTDISVPLCPAVGSDSNSNSVGGEKTLLGVKVTGLGKGKGHELGTVPESADIKDNSTDSSPPTSSGEINLFCSENLDSDNAGDTSRETEADKTELSGSQSDSLADAKENSCSAGGEKQERIILKISLNPPLGGSTSQQPEGSGSEVAGADSTEQESGELAASSWSREEDKYILETCKEEEDPEMETFVKIATKMNNKTPQQVSERFHSLMELFAAHHSESDASESGSEET